MQAAVPLAKAKFLGRDKAAFPETQASVSGAGLILQETAFGEGLEIERKALADQLLVQARRFALDGAKADMPLPGSFVWTQIVAANLPATDQLDELLAGFDTAGPGVGLIVYAGLVQLRRIETRSDQLTHG